MTHKDGILPTLSIKTGTGTYLPTLHRENPRIILVFSLCRYTEKMHLLSADRLGRYGTYGTVPTHN